MATAAARRYSKAILELAEAAGEVKLWSERLGVVRQFLTDPDLAAVLANPSVTVQRRKEVVETLGTHLLGREGLNLVKLLIETGRVQEIDGIIDEFHRLADLAAGRVRATAVTAIELPQKDVDQLLADLSRQLGKEVRLEVEVDPAIMGGLVLHVGDQLIDASVRTRLLQLRRRLATV